MKTYYLLESTVALLYFLLGSVLRFFFLLFSRISRSISFLYSFSYYSQSKDFLLALKCDSPSTLNLESTLKVLTKLSVLIFAVFFILVGFLMLWNYLNRLLAFYFAL
jgi:hypothetical protein